MFYRRQTGQSSFLKIFTFYNHKVNPEVPRLQKAVFDSMGMSINQVFDKSFSHGSFLNHICRNVTDTDYLIFFDVDCIPTTRNWLPMLLQDLQEPGTIAGAAQTANHLRDAQNLYVSPFFFGISTKYLRELHYPDMQMTSDMDAGQHLTETIRIQQGNIKYWWPTDIEEEKWYLHHPEHTKFGLGTTYNNAIYHAFYSRENQSAGFMRKCREVLAS
ncbi:hypothetical protein CLV59_107220 [Chitinophaga dinghuensis]|uniref:Glycosyl transferase family 2 n=1 Tax=Chitinophaga dinghuensis TaxID=1539050 RepID=A0A327VQY8_9BACT|nr:hypothetical protein [Chitinophaga dinghuensis]RAJ77453.1 hypothetical protein CLV59_107220 [Chitinophaga dinghuensis]